MENNNLPTGKESIKTIELEPGQSIRIKIIGGEETKLDPSLIERLSYLQEDNNYNLKGYLEKLADIICMIAIREDNCRQDDEETKEAILSLAYLRDHLKCIKTPQSTVNK